MCSSRSGASNGQSETALHAAAWAGNFELTKSILESGFDVNTQDSIGESALHGAAAWSQNKTIKLLLEYGADPNLKNQDGDTPLHWACSHGNKSTIKLLIDLKAEIQPNGSGKSLLEIAEAHNNKDNIAWLIQNT